jgi:hypothetical protein
LGAAVLTPWLLLTIAFASALAFREVRRAGWQVEWAGNAAIIWFYAAATAALFSGVGLFLLGVWRLASGVVSCVSAGGVRLGLAAAHVVEHRRTEPGERVLKTRRTRRCTGPRRKFVMQGFMLADRRGR